MTEGQFEEFRDAGIRTATKHTKAFEFGSALSTSISRSSI